MYLKIKFSIFYILFFSVLLFPQKLKLIGEPIPGNLLAGKISSASKIIFDDKEIYIDSTGLFIFGFDRDDKGTHTLKILLETGKQITKKLSLKKRKYKVQRINRLKESYVTPPPEIQKRIEEESKIIAEAKKNIEWTKTAYFKEGFIKPIKKGRISSVYGSRRILNGKPKDPHNGLDISVKKGTPIKAASAGKVLLAGNDFFYNGNFVLIDHGLGLTSIYLHMSEMNVRTGDYVNKGDIIGYVGSSGRATGPHLHWGVKWYNKRIDPASLLKLDLSKLN